MTAAAFQAAYSDWRIVKGRKVIQVVFELPLEAADTAYQVLGGMPIGASEIWCAIARLTDPEPQRAPSPSSSVAASPRPEPGIPVGADKYVPAPDGPRKFAALPYAQQAAMRCREPIYRVFLREMCAKGTTTHDECAEAIRDLCEVESRADIRAGTDAEAKWLELEKWFDAWKVKDRVMA